MQSKDSQTEDSQCLTVPVPEAGVILGVGRNTAYNMAREGVIPTIRLGRRLVVPRALLMKKLGAT